MYVETVVQEAFQGMRGDLNGVERKLANSRNLLKAVDSGLTELCNWNVTETNVLVFNYTMACPLACDFCCYGCSPRRKEKMPFELAIRLVDEAAELGVFSSVGFTGGEPLLFPDEILRLGDRLLALGLPSTIATACHWADTLDAANRMADALVERGLYRANVSFDPSHAAFVPSSSVLNAAHAFSQRGVATYVVGTFYSPDKSVEQFLPELIDLPGVKTVTKYVAKTGRAKKKRHNSRNLWSRSIAR